MRPRSLMRATALLLGLAAPALLLAQAAPAGATAKCKDGSYSTSKSRSGACAKHGGVTEWLATTKKSPKGGPAPAAAPAARPRKVGRTGPAGRSPKIRPPGGGRGAWPGYR